MRVYIYIYYAVVCLLLLHKLNRSRRQRLPGRDAPVAIMALHMIYYTSSCWSNKCVLCLRACLLAGFCCWNGRAHNICIERRERPGRRKEKKMGHVVRWKHCAQRKKKQTSCLISSAKQPLRDSTRAFSQVNEVR